MGSERERKKGSREGERKKDLIGFKDMEKERMKRIRKSIRAPHEIDEVRVKDSALKRKNSEVNLGMG